MANYSAIKAAVNAYIKQNGRKEITGSILNAILNSVIDSLGRYYQFAGGAMPSDDPGTPDQNVCYLATEPGVYTNFGGITIENEEVALLFWNGTWTKQRILIGIREVEASVDNQVGTPSVDVSYGEGRLILTFHNLKGEQGNQGDPAGFGTIGADITGGVGTPGVSVETSGGNDAKNIMFHFTNLKGETGVTSVVATIDDTSGTPSCQVSLVGGQLTLAFSGLKGLKGDTGVSADYPITIYNGLDSDATDQALSAAQGKVLDGKVTQLEHEVDEKSVLITGYDYTTQFAIATGSNVNTTVVGYNDNKAIPVTMKAGDVVVLSMETTLVDYVTLYIRKLGASSYTSTNKYLYANGTLEYTATDDIISLGFYRASSGVSASGDLAISAHIEGELTDIKEDITQLQNDLGAAVATIPSIVDNLTTEDATKGLSANQGVVLDGKIKDTQTEVRTKIDGLYESRSFKAGVDGVSFSEYFDTPADRFILRVNQIVGSTEKMLIQRIDGDGVASNYANNQPLDTDIEININKSTYPQMRVYAGSSYGTPTYTQDQTDFLLLVKTTLPGVREKTNELTERELKLDGKHLVRTLSVTSGTGVTNAASATPCVFSDGDVVALTMATSCVDYFTIYFKKKGESTWTSSGMYLYANRTPLYITIPYDVEGISFYRAAAGVTATGSVVINIGKYGDLDKANNLLGKKVVMFGDSITQLPNTGNTRGLGIPEFFEMFTGAKVYRIAIGGTKLSRAVATLPDSVQSASDASNCIQICSIVEGMATGNLTRQATAISDYLEDSFTEDVTLPLMQSIDLNDVDIVTIFGGTNDCSSGIALGTDADEDPTTINGAINFMVKKLLTAYPRLKVFVFTPIVRQYTANDPATWSDDYTPNGSIYLYQYAEKIMEASKKNHIPVCDLYYGMGWTRYNFATFCTDADKTHPRNGFDALAEKMSAFISANL